MSIKTNGAKIVGTMQSASNKVATLTTSNWDFAVITSYPPSIIRNDASISNNDYYGYGMEDAPVESIVWNNTTNYIPIWIMSSYVLITGETVTASGNSLTFSSYNVTNGRFSITLYKNS